MIQVCNIGAVIHPFWLASTTTLCGTDNVICTRGGIRPDRSLNMIKAGSLIPDAETHKATVKPFFVLPVVRILTVRSPIELFVLISGLSKRTMVWSMFQSRERSLSTRCKELDTAAWKADTAKP